MFNEASYENAVIALFTLLETVKKLPNLIMEDSPEKIAKAASLYISRVRALAAEPVKGRK